MALKNFEEIIQFAIKREEDAIRTYGEMAEKTNMPGLKKLLIDLQSEEKNHKKMLENISQEKLKSYEVKKVPDLKITDYLLEEPIEPEMNFQELLIYAAKKEQRAADLYSELASQAQDDDMKKTFEFMVQQEKSHKLKLEKEYEDHVLDEGWVK
ncbi:MAG: ferritin family protein [Candidatus Aminicenantes bacterium]|nr:ferritin family protein [Candidatus Aminicenantes bacterium]